MTDSRPRVRGSCLQGRALAALIIALVLQHTVEAHAHLGHLVLRAERYVKIDAAPGEVRVVVSLMLGPTETRGAIEPADTDEDGSVSRVEADAYLLGWAAELKNEIVISVDGAPAAEVVWRDGVLEPIGPIAAQPLTVEMIAHVAIRGGEHRVAVRDTMDLARFERTDVAFHARDGATLVRAGLGAEPRELERELSFGREFSPTRGRVFTSVIATPEDPTSPLWFVAIGAALLAITAVVVVVVKRRK